MSQRNHVLALTVTVIVLALVTMACGLSVNSPNVGQVRPTLPFQIPSQPGTPGAQNSNPPGQGGGAASTSTAPQIPQTGRDNPGQLASPLNTPPKSLEDLYTTMNPGVVSILVQVNQGGQSGAGAGSGFILTDQGLIATNHHVIEGASTIIVRFYNNADTQASVVGDDPNSDLAIVKVDKMAEGAHPIPLGNSDQVRVGDAVVAIGNPFALGTSMSSGIVSAVGRTIPSGFTPFNIPQAIQTDAAINPGNSGGPLINMSGEVIGINAQIRTSDQGGGNTGIGFAIPVNILKQIYPSLVQTGSYKWPYLGVSSPADNPLALNAANVQAQQGALIAQVESGGPADNAGIQADDIVIQADNQKITSFDDLLTYIAYKHPGDKVQLTIVRGNQKQQATVTLGERPNNSQLSPQQ